MSTQPSRQSWYHVFDRVYLEFHAAVRRGAAELLGRKLRRRLDAEDIVQSVFRTFYRRNSKGECQFDHTCALHNYLWTVMANKVRKHAQHHRAMMRSLAREVELDGSDAQGQFRDHWPTPEEWVVIRDEVRYLTRDFVPRDLEILHRRCEGYATSQIAEQVGCSRWTVRRVLDRFGSRLRQRLEDTSA